MAGKKNEVVVPELTSEQRQINLEWWTQGLGKDVILSSGLKSVFENTPKPGKTPVSDRRIAQAVNRTNGKFSFLPQDGSRTPSWLSENETLSHHSSQGPFELTFRVGEYRQGRFLPHWMLFCQTGRYYVSGSKYYDELIENIVMEVGARYKDPLKEPVVTLPIPPWIVTDKIYYCLESEYSQIIEEFIRQLVEIKNPNQHKE